METKQCKYCKEEISKDAKICPNCRKKQKSKKWIILVIVALIIIIAAIGAAGGSKETSGKVSNEESSSSVKSGEKYTVGEYVEKDGVKVSFMSISEGKGTEFFKPENGNTFVYAEFTIENNSDSELSISSLMCFDSYFDGYAANISVSAQCADESISSPDGTIAPGKKLNGTLAFEVSSDWKEYEVIVTPSFWDSDGITFTATSDQIK